MAKVVTIPSLQSAIINDAQYPQVPYENQCELIKAVLTDPRQKVIWHIIYLCSKQRVWEAVPTGSLTLPGENLAPVVCDMIKHGELLLVRVEGRRGTHVVLPHDVAREATIH